MSKIAKAVLVAALATLMLWFSPIRSAFGAGGTDTVLLQTQLSGANEVPQPTGDPNGKGRAFVFGVDGDPNTLCYMIITSKIAPAVAAHIHMAPAGTNGPIVVNFAPPTDGDSADCVTQGEILPGGAPAFPGSVTVADILGNPSGFYVNVHTGEWPAGAVRGQLSN